MKKPESTTKAGFILAALACVSAALLQTVAAQQAPASTEPAGGLQEVMVTAQKREQNLQDIGIAMSAISAADLTDLGVVGAAEITKSMPADVPTQPNGPSSSRLADGGGGSNDCTAQP